MKKLLLFLIPLFLWAGSSLGQVSAYSFTSSSGAYTAITGGTLLRDGTLTMDSWVSAVQTIPSFTFNGVAYTTAYVTSNGLLTLGGSAPSSTSYTAISTTTGSGIAICPFNADLDRATTTAASEIRWETVGNEIVFQWQQVKRYGSANIESFDMQVRLNTSSNNVVFVYKLNTGPGSSTSYYPQVGIRSATTDYKNRLISTGTENWDSSLPGTANTNTCRFTSVSPAKNFTTGLTYTFSPPLPCSGTPDPGNTLSTSNPACAGVNFTLSLENATPGTGVTYQWQSSPDGNDPWTDLGTATTQVTSQTSATYYRSQVTCDGNTGTSNPLQVNMFLPVTSFTENFDGAVAPAFPGCWAKVGTLGSTYTQTTNANSLPNCLYIYSGSNISRAVVKMDEVSNLGAGTHQFRFNMRAYFTVGGVVEFGYLTNPSDDATFVSFGSATASTLTYAEYTIIPAAGSYSNYPAIRHTGVPGNSLLIDDVKWELLPTCLPPTGLYSDNYTSSGADLHWTSPDSFFDIFIQLDGLPDPEPGTIPTINDFSGGNTYTWSGGSSGTTYDWWVRADCDAGGGTGVSNWVGPFTFTTVSSIPFFDGFETGNTHNTAIAGWIQEAVLGTNVWTANNSLTDYNRSPRTGSWNAFLRYSNTRWMFKAFELTGGVTYNFSMYARQDGPTAANSDITVSYGIAPNAASMTNTIVPATGIINGDYQEIAGSFMPGSSGTYYIGIRGFMNSTPWYISIDDISITEASSATLSWYNLQWPPSANISVYDNATVYAQCWESGVTEPDGPGAGIECWIGYNTANANDVSDFASGWTWVAAAYNYGADDPGFNNDEYMADLGAAQGLDEGTYYYVSRFRYNNGPFTYGGYNGGAWDGINNVSGVLTVFCPSITTYPFYESFETSWPPACWTNLNWDDSKYGAARTGTKWAYSNTNGSQLTTGEFEIPGTGLYQFSFWYRAESATYPQDFEVFISTDGINFTTSIFKATGITNTTYKEVVYFLNAYSSSSVWFRFVGQYGTGGYAYGVCIDDVAVIESPATAVWTGALNNNWFAPGNWNTYVPGPNTDVTIPAGLTNYPTILSDPAYCNDVFFGSAAGSTATLLDNGLLTVYGTATVERYFSGNDPDWHLVSSPVSNALADVFMGMYLQSFDEATNSYAEIIDETTPLGVMEGYGLYSTLGATNTVSFNGALNLGTKNKGFTANGLGWNLIGNPFVSSVNWEMVTIPANLSSEVHYIEAATGNDLSYVKGVGGSGSQYIPPMQGFFVSATGSGTLSVGNAQRSHAGANIFYKSSNPNLVVLNATNGLFNDEAWIHFNELAGAEHDGQFDAHKRISLSNPLLPQIFSYTLAGMKLSVNGLPEVQSVPVGFTVLQSGEFTISAIETGDFSELYLEDLFTGNITNLLSANYTFNYNQGDTENRFILHFAPLSVGDNLERNSTIWSYGNEVIVMVPDLTNGHVKVYNMMGQEVVSSGVTSGRNVITVPQPGNYVVTLISNEVVRAEKVVIK